MTKHKTHKKINLALQGGGAHGAFTWGVLDKLLEDGRLEFEAITATSAGSMNAVMMLTGHMQGGADGARQKLETFWRRVSSASNVFGGVSGGAYDMLTAANPFLAGYRPDQTLQYKMMEGFVRTFSPYQFNPFNMNPLRDILEDLLDIEALHACKMSKLFVAATRVKTGTAQIFSAEDVTIDALLASACLPSVFQAVEINGEAYWDGGYIGNPTLWPLFYEASCRDILIVHVNPLLRDGTPKSVDEIDNRLNEITFNASLLKELRAVSFVKKLIRQEMLKEEYQSEYKDMLLHAIRTDKAMRDLAPNSKYDTSWEFLTHLRDLGRAEATTWLHDHFDDIGKRDSVDINEDYLNYSKPRSHR